MNITIYKDTITNRNTKLEKLVLKTQNEMKEYVKARLRNNGKYVVEGDGYVYYRGTFPVLLVAHMDTVHKELPTTLVYANGTLSSTQGIGGDDRCGIYMIFKILQKYNCSVVFLEDEEIGCVGAKKFANSTICKDLKKEGKLKYIIEFDRKGHNHAVTYDCDNKEFDDFITKEFFVKEYGTCSDISYIAPELGIAAVNLSCGYHKEHNIEEWINLSQMERIIVEAMNVLERTKDLKEPFKYIKAKNSTRYGYGYGYGYYDWDSYYEDYYGRYSGYSTSSSYNYEKGKNNKNNTKYIFRYKMKDSICMVYIPAEREEDAYYKFFKKYRNVCYSNIISVTKEER